MYNFQQYKHSVPYGVLRSIKNFALEGGEPGGFTRAVLENNLIEAVGAADPYSLHALHDICKVLYNELPSSIWGSPEKVRAHIKKMAEGESEVVGEGQAPL